MEFADLKKAYCVLRKKYQLPEFKEIHQEFELQHIEDEEHLLRSVRRRIHTKILFFVSILESILYPSGQSPSSSYESGFFTSDDKQDLSKVYKKLMILSRKHVRLDVASTEKEDALFIREAHTQWSTYREVLKRVTKDMGSCWEREADKEQEGYLG